MKKAICLIIAAAMLTSGTTLAFAQSSAAEQNVAAVQEGIDLFASVDGITFEYDYSNSSELVRVVKVKYNKAYFTKGISKFNAEISIPSQYVESVECSSKLTGLEITDSFENDVYKVSGESGVNVVPMDDALFTMNITLKQNILNPFAISLTGNSYLGDDTGTTQYLTSGGMNGASITIPANLTDGYEDGGTDGAVTWHYSNGVLTLNGNGTMSNYEQGSAPWYKHADKIKSIVFTEDNLQNIGKNAFYGLQNAESVKLSKDISAINDHAFEGCTSLKNIDIPTSSGVGIGNYAFKDCTSLTAVEIPSGVRVVGLGAFEGCTRLSSMTLPFIGEQNGKNDSVTTFSHIFNSNVPESLKIVSITDETLIPESAFENCEYIENIYINADVTSMGSKAFKGCSRLKNFNIPLKVTKINDYTFQGCSSIEMITVTDAITAIGTGAFDGCKMLSSIYVPNVSAINDYTFRNCAALTQITIPNSVKTIGASVLAGCDHLKDIKVPFVGANADPGDIAVTENGIFGYFFGVADNNMIPASVTKVEVTGTDKAQYIPKEAFKNCANIEDIIIDGGRCVLGSAFANCKNLRNLYIPKSINTISSESILDGCTQLETLVVPFVGTDETDINTETSVLGGFFGYDDRSQAKNIMQYYRYDDGVPQKHYYKIPSTLKNVSVLNQINIPVGAFMNCEFIENVSIISGATMNERAFFKCTGLKNVILPNDMVTIKSEAFAECDSLENINIPAKVKTIGENVFYNARNLKNVTMPDSVTTIADNVFNGTNLYTMSDMNLMSDSLTITCSEGSEAQKYAEAKGIATNIVPSSELDVTEIGVITSATSTGGCIVDVTDGNKLSGVVYAALYDSNDRMIAVKKQETENNEVEYRFDFTKDESNEASYTKVFVWGGNENVKPLAEKVTKSV